jgi:hypothetical protein
MSFRDDLEAAHARIAMLERELEDEQRRHAETRKGAGILEAELERRVRELEAELERRPPAPAPKPPKPRPAAKGSAPVGTELRELVCRACRRVSAVKSAVGAMETRWQCLAAGCGKMNVTKRSRA